MDAKALNLATEGEWRGGDTKGEVLCTCEGWWYRWRDGSWQSVFTMEGLVMVVDGDAIHWTQWGRRSTWRRVR